MRIDIDIKYDDDEAQENLDDMIDRGKDFRPVFRKIREELRSAFSANFLSNGLPVGGWRPLDPQYASWKAVNFPGAPPMVQTGELFRNLASLRGKSSDIDKRTARFGTSGIKYASFHQYGTSKMPKREIVFVPQGAEQRWSGWAADYIVNGAEATVTND